MRPGPRPEPPFLRVDPRPDRGTLHYVPRGPARQRASSGRTAGGQVRKWISGQRSLTTSLLFSGGLLGDDRILDFVVGGLGDDALRDQLVFASIRPAGDDL